jgi:menaquinone-dependent protoporphyrinogen IX oxidase
MKICPICREAKLDTEDVNDATWVALGEPVCSRECHEEAYDFVRHTQLQLQLQPVGG